MRLVIIAIVFLVVGFASAYFWFGDAEAVSESASHGDAELYTCGMHPEVVSSEPGVCPICNMNLTPKKTENRSSSTITVDPAARQNMGLVTTLPTYGSLSRTVRTFGKVTVAEPNVYSVNLKIGGWVEKLFVSENGQRVFKGQPLLEIYSPELVTAQREYLVAVGSAGSNDNLRRFIRQAENRLRNWDVPEDQLTRLKEGGEISRTMLIRTPADGYVLRKNVNVGDQVAHNAMLYEIGDLSTVWVTAYVYEQDLPYIALNQRATVRTPGLPGRIFASRVVYISPTLDAKGQTEIRLALDNPDFALKPEMYAEVEVKHRALHERLAIPRSAVINSGTKQVVYIASTDDTFEPRMVTTGAVDDNDMIEILDGLAPQERVVTSGQFLLDSESRLGEATGIMAGHNHGGGATTEESPEEKQHEHGDSMENMDTSMTQVHDHSDHATAGSDPYDIHTCPMPQHYHVLNYGPGDCPECGMTLVPVSETDNKDVFVCPMPQCQVAQPDSAQCPHCNMNLIRYQPGANDAE
ncbi:MAG: efflux RND transporter periplasmic adaptor subunit [Candidatus Zixiibacteriota bacterium]|nr:MAG: efflux RND transporter periplasmic adaptor subunit [candidate division Zixibacteria bacterium]